jgi:hypothetical protein
MKKNNRITLYFYFIFLHVAILALLKIDIRILSVYTVFITLVILAHALITRRKKMQGFS